MTKNRQINPVKRNVITVLAMLALLPSVARADGIDIVGFMMRCDSSDSIFLIIGKIVAFMAINYSLNCLVIGAPAIFWQKVDSKRVMVDLGKITLWGQVTDRLGALAAMFSVIPIGILMRLNTLPEVGILLVFLTFIYSGIGFYIVSLRFVHRRWGVAEPVSKGISLTAAIICNPAWVLYFLV